MTPRHFYNLCWLQYIGRFNKDTDGDGVINQVYFSLENDIDCSTLGSALPPIGTTRYPFVGNFTGNDHIISNYTITDEYARLTKHPSIIDTENTYYTQGNKTINYCSIIGTFGVIGYNTIGAIDVSDVETSLYGFSSDQLKVNTVSNLYIDNVTIKPTTQKTLAGLLAGYVSANMSSCGVHYSQFNFDNNTNIDSKFNNKISNYSLIGDYNSNEYKWSDVPSSGSDIGGSLDIFSLSKRISYMTQNLEKNTRLLFSDTSTWHLSMGLSNTSSKYYDALDTTGISAMLIYNTYLPLNVESTSITADNYKKKNKEVVLSNKNTGYIVGGGNEDSAGYGNAEVRLRNQACSKDGSGLDNSFTTKNNINNNNKDEIISENNINLWYYDSIKNSSSKIDSTIINNLIKKDNKSVYSTVKTNLVNMLYDATTTSNSAAKYYVICPGFFIRKQKSTIDLENHILTGTDVEIYENSYSSYQFYTGGVNFSLNDDGYLTIVMANYANSSTGFFDIYKVDRNYSTTSEGKKTSTLNGYHKISKISKTLKSNNSSEYTYGYSYSDGTVDNFDANNTCLSFEKNTSAINARSLYYFEIPLKAGDYFYSIPYGLSNNPYTVYINIGANSSSSGESKGSIQNVDFVYQQDGKLIKITDSNKSKIVFDISGNGKTYFYFKRNETLGVLYFADYDTLNITPTKNGNVDYHLATDSSCSTVKS